MNRNFVRRNITSFAVMLFIILYGTMMYIKPGFLFNNDGSLREFGVGFSKKTVIPAWFLSILLAIFSYFSILYYLAIPKLTNY